MSRAERRRKQREELKVLAENKKREHFADSFIKEFTPAQLLKIHKYAEILKEIEIKEGISIIEKFANIVIGNAIQGALAEHTDINTEDYPKILKSVRSLGIEDGDAIMARTKKSGKMRQITAAEGMEEFYMSIEKKDVQMINKAKELLQQKYNQKRVIETLKKEFSVPTGAANIAFRKAKEILLNETIKEVAKEATKDIIEPVRTTTIKEKVIEHLNKSEKITFRTKAEIIKEIKKKFKITDATADTYYYAWKKQYMNSNNCKPIEVVEKEVKVEKEENPVLNNNENKGVEKMNETTILDQLKDKLNYFLEEKENLKSELNTIQTKLQEIEKNEKAVTVAVNALEGVNL